MRPIPPVESEQDDVRYFHIHENDQFDEELVTGWIRQASELPGTNCFGGVSPVKSSWAWLNLDLQLDLS